MDRVESYLQHLPKADSMESVNQISKKHDQMRLGKKGPRRLLSRATFEPWLGFRAPGRRCRSDDFRSIDYRETARNRDFRR